MEIDNTISQQNETTNASPPVPDSIEQNAPPSQIQLLPIKAEPGTNGYQPKPTITPEDIVAPAPLVNIKPEVAHLPPQDPSLDSTAIAEQKRIFGEKTAKIDARIASDMWDLDAWTALINEAQSKDIRVARDIYERFLKQFPTAGRYWKVYAEHELLSGNYEQVDQIFNRSLLKCYNIDLWKFYVNYIKVTKEKDLQTESRADLNKAYEFALQHMGIDINSTQIWSEYLSLLKESKPNGQYEEGQKITLLRRIYHRAIENPMNNLENIWKEYDAFENDLNKILAKALINEKAPKYMAARSLYRERKRHYEGILRNMLARPPGYGGEKEAHQVSLWKRLLEFEKTNPQKLEPPMLENRIVFTYNQCLLCLYHYPELWYDFAMYRLSCGSLEAASAVFDRAIEAIPTSLILHFAYADMLESQKNTKSAKEVYEKLLTQQQTSMVFIQYMKFSRRTEGMKEARLVFKRGRTSPTITYHLFVSAALMEWHLNKDINVARNIFELGMTKFGVDSDYVIEYIKFLQHLNEENNLRVLFEKAVGQIPKEQCKEIWNLYLQFENNYGDLNTIQKIENRKAKLYPELESIGIMSLVNRFKYGDLWPCEAQELESFEREAAPKVEEGKEEVVTVTTRLNVAMVDTSRFIRPDLNQLALFNNEPQMMTGLPSNIPEIISQFILSMPAPQTWSGPLVDVDQLIGLYNESTLPPPPAGYEQSVLSTDSKKRKVEDDDEEEDQPISQINLPPSDDLFRKRQAAKLRQKNL